jgi:DNA-binding XRE family transcriptional regulator
MRQRQRLEKTKAPMLTASQLRAGRALVGWSREALAKRAGVSWQTVTGIELLGRNPYVEILHKVRRALERAGVVISSNVC